MELNEIIKFLKEKSCSDPFVHTLPPEYLKIGHELIHSCDPKEKATGYWIMARLHPDEFYYKAIELDPTNSYLYSDLAYYWYENADKNDCITLNDGRVFDTPIDLCKVALNIDPTNSSAHNNMGTHLRFMNDDNIDACNSFVMAIKYNPNNVSAYCNLGHILPHYTLDIPSITLDDGRVLNWIDLYICALELNFFNFRLDYYIGTVTSSIVFIKRPWTRRYHSLGLYGKNINILIATLLLGMQMLEDQKIIAPSHHMMIEDMFDDNDVCHKY